MGTFERALRRRFRKPFSGRRGRQEMTDTGERKSGPDTSQDVASVRAKNQRHGKVTADKWNQ